MSGTSMDAVDGVLVQFDQDGQIARTLAKASIPMPDALRQRLTCLQFPGHDELSAAAIAANQLADLYLDCVEQLLSSSGVPSRNIRAIGAHGQTVRHAPDAGYSLQLLNAARLAVRSGIDVIHDLRSADIAAHGQGAPLMPAFHAHVFRGHAGRYGILNLGGIANLSVIDNESNPAETLGFDTGPANTLLDQWSEQHRGVRFDDRGHWAASGRVIPALLEQLLTEPYFSQPPPKSTGREHFNLDWLQHHLQQSHSSHHAPADIQATLAALTAESAGRAIRSQRLAQVYVCGGGAENHHLISLIQAASGQATAIRSTQELGIAPMAVEATGFAWLARQRVWQAAIDLRRITGAQAPCILGSWHAVARADNRQG